MTFYKGSNKWFSSVVVNKIMVGGGLSTDTHDVERAGHCVWPLTISPRHMSSALLNQCTVLQKQSPPIYILFVNLFSAADVMQLAAT